MFKVTMESEDRKVQIEEPKSDLSLEELLPLLEDAIRALGYCPKGQLNFIQEEGDEE